MNLFNACQQDGSPSHRNHMDEGSRQKPKVVNRSNNRKIIEYDNLLYDCPDTDPGNPISGQVYILNASTKNLLFEGIFRDNEKNGFGIEYDNNKNIIYQGEYRHDVRDGWGKTEQYEGQFRDDRFDGWGRLLNEDHFYQGYFQEGEFHGKGVYIKPYDKLKNGQKFLEPDTIEEYILKSIEKDSNKLFLDHNIEEIYIGQWAQGLKNGSGKLWGSDGYWYNGQFSYGVQHGIGAQQKDFKAEARTGTFKKGQKKEEK